jgi:hypothetical protein
MKFIDGEVVYYRHDRKGLLGPFTLRIMSDGSVDLWTQEPSPDGGEHVHRITNEGKVLLAGRFSRIAVKRLVRPT